jgi:hypothetical protein
MLASSTGDSTLHWAQPESSDRDQLGRLDVCRRVCDSRPRHARCPPARQEGRPSGRSGPRGRAGSTGRPPHQDQAVGGPSASGRRGSVGRSLSGTWRRAPGAAVRVAFDSLASAVRPGNWQATNDSRRLRFPLRCHMGTISTFPITRCSNVLDLVCLATSPITLWLDYRFPAPEALACPHLALPLAWR